MEIQLRDIRIEPVLDSIYKEKISDDEYFSAKYRHFISNSRLKLIDPNSQGSPEAYKKGFDGYTTSSLFLGSCVHCLVLQPEEFTLGPDLQKPSAKLGLVCDLIRQYRRDGLSIHKSITQACNIIGYYVNSINESRIRSILEAGLFYYMNSREYDDSVLLAATRDRHVIEQCVSNLQNNRDVQRVLHPIDLYGDPIPSFNEEAFFIDFKCTYNDKTHIIKFKMKADNWTIDVKNKIITLNDLKTTSHFCSKFMDTSWHTFSYDRQFAGYIYVLLRYCEKVYGYNREEWSVKANVIVSETRGDHRCKVFPITLDMLETGRKEFCKLLKMVAYCEMFDYPNVTFK